MNKILAFAGSLRRESFNRKALRIATEGARATGAEVTLLELADLPLPLFDEDTEAREGLHPNARKLKDLMIAHQGFLVACPEYNSSITPLLKNALDWASRADGSEAGGLPYRNKVVGLVAASAGMLGGLRGLRHVREIFGNLGCTVLPEQYALSRADAAFDEQGNLRDEKTRKALHSVGARLAAVVANWT